MGSPHAAGRGPEGQLTQFSGLSVQDAIDDLAARFIVNIPAKELEDMVRVCFQIELAHWYYEDFVRPAASQPALFPSYTLKQFYVLMLRSCELLTDLLQHADAIWTNFMAYKVRVPVCGAILISKDWNKVLLVKGWQKGASWSFPRGKINQNEPEGACAVREVFEETGYNTQHAFPEEQLRAGYVEPEGAERNPYYIEVVIKEQKIRLYFIHDIPEDTYFATQTRKEISKIDWFKVSDLPTWNKAKKGKKTGAIEEKQPKFYMVTPFISHFKLWIDRMRPPSKVARKRNAVSTVPRPINPTPRTAHTHDGAYRALPPHLQGLEKEEYRPPPFESDGDFGHSTSASSTSTEDETADDRDEPERSRPTAFRTIEEGTQALEAFFFNGEPPAERPATPTDAIDAQSSVAEPDSSDETKRREYERHASFVQPKPKLTSQDSNRLLALLTNKNPVASPPPPRRKSRSKNSPASAGPSLTGASLSFDEVAGQPPATAASLLASLVQAPRPPSSAASSSAVAESILFDSAAPAEAEGFGETRVRSDVDRGNAERDEKHSALLRALYSVASSPPVDDNPNEDPRTFATLTGTRDTPDLSQWPNPENRRKTVKLAAQGHPYQPWDEVDDYRDDTIGQHALDQLDTLYSEPRPAWQDMIKHDPVTGEARFFPTGPVDPTLRVREDGSLSFSPTPLHERDGERRTNSDRASPLTRAGEVFVDAPSSPATANLPSSSMLMAILNGRGVQPQQASPTAYTPPGSFSPPQAYAGQPLSPQNRSPGAHTSHLHHQYPLPSPPQPHSPKAPSAPFRHYPSPPQSQPPYTTQQQSAHNYAPEPTFALQPNFGPPPRRISPSYVQPRQQPHFQPRFAAPPAAFPPFSGGHMMPQFAQNGPPMGGMVIPQMYHPPPFNGHPPQLNGNNFGQPSPHFGPPFPSHPSFTLPSHYPPIQQQPPPAPLFNPHSPQRADAQIPSQGTFAPFSPERQHQPHGINLNAYTNGPTSPTVVSPQAGNLLSLFNNAKPIGGS